MKKVVLQTLTLENFKGCVFKGYDFGKEGGNIAVYARNAGGKTTLKDAWLWLLFGIDSQFRNESSFDFRPMRDGIEDRDVTVSVRAVFTVDGKPTKFARESSVVKSETRGNGLLVDKGNTTKYFIDGAAYREKDYKQKVEEIIDLETFKILTIPGYFCSDAVHWTDRRRALMGLLPDIPDEKEFARITPKYAPVVDLIDKHGLDKARESAAATVRILKEKRDALPAAIQENIRILESIDISRIREAKHQKSNFEKEIANIDEQLASASKAMEAHRAKYAAINNLERLKNKDIQAFVDEARTAHIAKMEAWTAKKREVSDYERDVEIVSGTIDMLKKSLERTEQETADLRKEWERLNAQQFTPPEIGYCPTCNRQNEPLTQDELAALELQFNQAKQRRMEANAEQGKEWASDIKRMQQEIVELETKLAMHEQRRAEAEAEAIKIAPGEFIPPEPDTSAQDAEIELLKSQIKGIVEVDTQQIALRKSEINEKINNCMRIIAQEPQREELKRRISELQSQEEELQAEINKQQEMRALLDELQTERCKMLEKKINTLFGNCTWRLFETQKNGGVKDVCDCIYTGVSYGSTNNAAKMWASLEIIDVMAEHYGIAPPVFIDNAESYNKLPETHGQRITLSVSEDPVLRYVVEVI